MEKAKEKIGTSRNVENKNMKLNLGLPLNGNFDVHLKKINHFM